MELAAVIELAREAHDGQRDKLGRDYFLAHLAPIAAGAALFGEKATQAAWMHDIIEDTDMTANQLLSLGVDAEVVSAVEAVTRRDEEPYEDYIRRVSRHPVGRLVKVVDNAWNIVLNAELAELDPGAAKRLLDDRYLPARDWLLAAIGINECWLGYSELVSLLTAELEALRASVPASGRERSTARLLP